MHLNRNRSKLAKMPIDFELLFSLFVYLFVCVKHMNYNGDLSD